MQAKDTKPDKVILQLHGGAYIRSLEKSGMTYRRTAIQYAKISGAGLNYKRVIPEYVGDNRADNPYISPIYGEYAGFPPMLMQVGGDEILLNDTVKVAQKAEAAGVSVRQTTYPGMFHDFQLLFPKLPDANKAWNEVETFIKEIYAGQPETP